jgi:Arc/MetJ family transcription regulator
MRTTLNIDDDLVDRARELSGIQEKTALVEAGLKALIAREASKRLAAMGGSNPNFEVPPRRRSVRTVDAKRRKAG